MKCYRNITTDEVVYKDEAEEYVLNRLGVTITPKGRKWRNDSRTIRKYRKYSGLVFQWKLGRRRNQRSRRTKCI